MLVIWLKKQIITLKLQKLKISLITIIMINILILRSFENTNFLAVGVFNVRIAQANLVTKRDFDAKLSGLNRKIKQNICLLKKN